jgi:transcriptional regulator with XRE-family HTH domain
MTMPPAASGTTVVRRQLGRRLRRLREQAGKTTADVQAAKLASTVKLWRVETGKIPVRIADVRALCWLYGADAATTDALTTLAEGTTGQDWWERGWDDEAHLVGFDLYLGLEAAASRLSLYQPEAVHGLFQTEEYARAVQWCTLLEPTPDQVERTVRIRLTRQDRLFGRATPPGIRLVLSELALTREVGSAEVMAEQRAQLLEFEARDGVEVRVLPVAAGPHAGIWGEFALLDFDDPDDPTVAYTETDAGALFVETPDGVGRKRRIFARLQELSVPIEEFPS